MSRPNKLMGRGILSPVPDGVLDYPLAAVLIVLSPAERETTLRMAAQ